MISDINSLFSFEIGKPDYVRFVNVNRNLENETKEERINIWLPQWGKSECWLTIIQATWIHKDKYSVSSGDDKLSSLLSGIYMLRMFVDENGNDAFFKGDNKAGLPIWINNAISSSKKREIEKVFLELQDFEIEQLKF